MIKMIWKTLAVDKMDIEKTADLKCISRLLVEKWHVDQIKMKITVSPAAGYCSFSGSGPLDIEPTA